MDRKELSSGLKTKTDSVILKHFIYKIILTIIMYKYEVTVQRIKIIPNYFM